MERARPCHAKRDRVGVMEQGNRVAVKDGDMGSPRSKKHGCLGPKKESY